MRHRSADQNRQVDENDPRIGFPEIIGESLFEVFLPTKIIAPQGNPVADQQSDEEELEGQKFMMNPETRLRPEHQENKYPVNQGKQTIVGGKEKGDAHFILSRAGIYRPPVQLDPGG